MGSKVSKVNCVPPLSTSRDRRNPTWRRRYQRIDKANIGLPMDFRHTYHLGKVIYFAFLLLTSQKELVKALGIWYCEKERKNGYFILIFELAYFWNAKRSADEPEVLQTIAEITEALQRLPQQPLPRSSLANQQKENNAIQAIAVPPNRSSPLPTVRRKNIGTRSYKRLPICTISSAMSRKGSAVWSSGPHPIAPPLSVPNDNRSSLGNLGSIVMEVGGITGRHGQIEK
ncbi:hypothetical protein EC973_003196 [Apophysomyces ossiformis]|uniref:CRIB domain-containing protein n=1 Tax=Apophysomyces ossiformis TaxID=679940 RepID=A0A8H7BHD3_9FUNG|nr:hypothetical protein EC973_003196 [Apophysomyces ossiformis]